MKQPKFDILEKLGEGAYGTVFKAIHPQFPKPIAVKVVKITENDDGFPSTSAREVAILKSINHPNVIQYVIN